MSLLSLASVGACASLRRALDKRFGTDVGMAFVALSITQFHLPFYWSRSLPNTFALILSTLAFGRWVSAFAHDERGQTERPACRAELKTAIGLLTAVHAASHPF